MNIVITGATGFIGKNLTRYIQSNINAKVYAIVRKKSDVQFLKDQNIELVFYDGTFDSLNKFFSKKKVDLIVHLATLYLFNHKSSDIDSLIDSNIRFGSHLLEAASLNNCKNFINIGSYIQNFFSEEYYPSCLYAATKQAFQNIVDYYSVNRDFNVITLKLYDVYGPLDERKKIINLFKECYESKKELKMSPGEQEVRLVYIDDVIKAVVVAINLFKNSQVFQEKESKHKIYYIGSKPYKIKEVAQIFEEVIGAKLNINWGALPYRKNQPLKSYMGELLPGWKPEIDLKNGIKKFLNS